MDAKDHKKTTVSVIIPAKNEEDYLPRTLSSVRAQTCKDVEIVVVVNGSTDRTAEVARPLADTVLEFKEGFGPSRARNEGVQRSGGDLLIFLDADSTISRGTIARIIAKRRRSALPLFGTVRAHPSNRSPVALCFFYFKNLVHSIHLYKGVLALMFVDRELFLKIGGFDPKRRVGEYKDFSMRAQNAGARYAFVKRARVTTSTRRFEKEGYLATLFFWLKWALVSPWKKRSRVEKEYDAVR